MKDEGILMMNDYDCRLLETMGFFDGRLHFNESIYNMAINEMENEDGTKGAHWDIEKIKEIVDKEKDLDLGPNNIYDFAYTMNMLYSDYFDLIKEEKDFIDFAKKFLLDKDAPEGKALKYYRAMKGI